jgi:hypothetical protein
MSFNNSKSLVGVSMASLNEGTKITFLNIILLLFAK